MKSENKLSAAQVAAARACLAASADAYALPETFGSALAHVRDTQVNAEITKGPTPDWQESRNGMRIFAFRGSASARDWLTDFECLRVCACYPALGMEVHRGFHDAAYDVFRELKERCGYGTQPIYLTGHSLGGALAILSAWLLRRAGVPVAGVYTFGAPRVGNGAWKRSYEGLRVGELRVERPETDTQLSTPQLSTLDDTQLSTPQLSTLGSRTVRFVNEEDIVPRLPGWLMGFRNVGRECFFPAWGPARLGAPLWFKALSDALGTWLDWKRGRLAQLVDHPVNRYRFRFEGEFGTKAEITKAESRNPTEVCA